MNRRRIGLRRCLLFGVPIVAAIALLAGTAAARAQPGNESTVSSTSGWQKTAVSLKAHDEYTVSYVSGSWTVDYRNFPRVGPQGYSDAVDKTIYQGCKYDASRNYAVLLGKVGASGATFPIGASGLFTASSGGSLYLRINDDDACLGDNAGSVTMYIAPVQRYADAGTTYAGYSISAGLSGSFTYAAAQWVVPKVLCPGGLNYPRTAAWVGLWGNDGSISAGTAWLPQIGTVSSCTLFGNSYLPFWEMETGSNVSNGGAQGYGAGPQTISAMSIAAGDTVFGAVEYEGKSGNDLEFDFSLFDETRGKPGSPDQFEMSVITNGPVPADNIMFQGGSVVEGNCQGLAPFTTIPFSDVQATTSAYPGIQEPTGVSLNEWLLNGNGVNLASPSDPSGFPSALTYSVKFHRGTPPPAC